HVPIIALTAHAMKGDRERCLQAGMDGYVAKPIRARELFQAMEQVLRAHAPQVLEAGRRDETKSLAATTREENNAMGDAYDRKAFLERCGEDVGVCKELIDVFFLEIDGWMRDLGAAVAAGDAKGVYLLAHKIKGGVSIFGAERAHDLALRLEQFGKRGDVTAARPVGEEMQGGGAGPESAPGTLQ